MTTQLNIRNASLTVLTVIGAIAVLLVGLMAVMHFGMMGGNGSLSDMFKVCANMIATPR